jgi:hypothetical protein
MKQLPHEKIILVKQFIKDFNLDIATVKAQIKVLSATLLYSAKVKNTALADEAWPVARQADKIHKTTLAQIDRLQCVKRTLETVRDQYGNKCRRLRTLNNNLKRAEAQLERAKSGYYDSIHARAQAIESSERFIRSIHRSFNAFEI